MARLLAIDPPPHGWQLVSSSSNARVAYHSEEQLYYKEFYPRGPLERLKSVLVGSRATRSRKNDAALLSEGFGAPLHLASGQLSNHHHYSFSKAVAGEGITDWCRVHLKNRTGEALRQRRRLLHCMGQFVGRMHASGFTHGDLRTSNILAAYGDDGFDFSLIDNERTRRQAPASGRHILRNLMQLNMLLPSDITRTDRWRFFLAWQQQMPGFSRVESRLLALESYRWAMRRLAAKGLI